MDLVEESRLKAFVGLAEGSQPADPGAGSGLFFWNVAIEASDLPDWTLVSEQFVQMGEDRQYSAAVWTKTGPGGREAVRTEVEALSDAKVARLAFVQRLASAQTLKLARVDPGEVVPGIVFATENGNVVMAQIGNLVIVIMRLDEGTADLVETLGELVGNLGDDLPAAEESGGTGEEREIRGTSPVELRRADVTARAAAGETAGEIAEEDFEDALKVPDEAAAPWPVNRTDRPDRVAALSVGGKLQQRAGRISFHPVGPGQARIVLLRKRPGTRNRSFHWRYRMPE